MDTAPRPYLTVRPLHPASRPVLLTRRRGAVLLQVHPGTPLPVLLAYAVDNLTVAEQNAYRSALGAGPVGTPVADDLLDGACWSAPAELLLDAERNAAQARRTG